MGRASVPEQFKLLNANLCPDATGGLFTKPLPMPSFQNDTVADSYSRREGAWDWRLLRLKLEML